MKFLYISPDGFTVALAARILWEGHEVKVYAKQQNEMHGILTYVKDWKPYITWADVIISDDVMMDEVDILHKSGAPYVGGNKLFNRLENDRVFGKKIFRQLGLDIRDCAQFTNFDTAIKFINKFPDRWVVKANGQANRILGYVGELPNGADVIDRLQFYKQHAADKMKKLWDKKLGIDFVLERYVEGTEVACGGYWDGHNFSAVNINFEHKKRSVGNLGIATGEMGTVLRGLSLESNFYRATLAKLIPLLKKHPYCTYVDLNCIITKDKAYVLEITSRFGWPIEAALDSCRTIPTSEFYKRLGSGRLGSETTATVTDLNQWATVFVLTTFGFPFASVYEELGAEQPVQFPRSAFPNVYLSEVSLPNGRLTTSLKGKGQPMCVTGTGVTLAKSKQNALDVINKVRIPGLDYRTDIGDHVPESIIKLKKWQWI